MATWMIDEQSRPIRRALAAGSQVYPHSHSLHCLSCDKQVSLQHPSVECL